jgi:hypothetical protein
MTNSSDEQDGGRGIGDEDLPEDLQPGDDNPLAGGFTALPTDRTPSAHSLSIMPGGPSVHARPTTRWERWQAQRP